MIANVLTQFLQYLSVYHESFTVTYCEEFERSTYPQSSGISIFWESGSLIV